MIICIDGANFVGKTTIINEVRKNIPNIKVIEDYEIKEIADKVGNYLEARLEIQRKYKLQTTNDNIIICRWFPSMYVFDYSNNYVKFKEDMKKLVNPDITFVIGASFINILKRKKSRIGFKFNRNILKQLIQYKKACEILNYKYYENNSICQRDEIVKRIVNSV